MTKTVFLQGGIMTLHYKAIKNVLERLSAMGVNERNADLAFTVVVIENDSSIKFASLEVEYLLECLVRLLGLRCFDGDLMSVNSAIENGDRRELEVNRKIMEKSCAHFRAVIAVAKTVIGVD